MVGFTKLVALVLSTEHFALKLQLLKKTNDGQIICPQLGLALPALY